MSLQSLQTGLNELHQDYYWNPHGFVVDILGANPHPWQAEVLRDIVLRQKPDLKQRYRKFSIRSGHGVGKTTLLAWLVVWFLWTRFPQKTAITAPTSSQLFDALWPEIGKWIKRLKKPLRNELEITGDRIRFKPAPEESFVSAKTSRPETPEAMAGVHSDNVLLLFDEASGIPEAVFEAAAGSMSGEEAITILTGNPVRSSGMFYETHNLLSDWKAYHISCLDCVASGQVSQEFIKEFARKYGEDSNQYRVRVLGEFPLADDDTVIPMSLIKAAVERDVQEIGKSPEVWGLDVARSGSNSTVLIRRRGLFVDPEILAWQGKDTMQTTGHVKHKYDALPESQRPVEILIDSVGVGGGVADRLIELGLPARAVNVGEAPALKPDQFVNLRAELWWTMREWLEQKNCKIPNHDKLIKELAAVRIKHYTSAGKMQVESKDDMKARRERSPDFADALMLTFASTAGIAMYGWGHARNKPPKRNIKGVV